MGYTRALIFENVLGLCRGSELADPFAAHDHLFLRMLAAGMPSHSRSFLGRSRSPLDYSRSFLGYSRTFLGYSRSFLGRSRSPLGRSASPLGYSRTFLGHSRSLLRLFKLKLASLKSVWVSFLFQASFDTDAICYAPPQRSPILTIAFPFVGACGRCSCSTTSTAQILKSKLYGVLMQYISQHQYLS